MISRQRQRLFLMVSASLLLFVFTSVQFQAQRLIPPPAAPGELTSTRAAIARDTELLQNGSFEIAGLTSGTAADWTPIRLLSQSKRVCNRIGHPTKPDKIVAHDASCAFRFSAEITNIKRQLKQVIIAPPGVATDTLEFSYWATAAGVAIKPYAQVKIKYTDGTKDKFKVPAEVGTYPYMQFTRGTTLTNTVKKIIVKFIVEGGGKLHLDAASLIHSPFEFAPTAIDDSIAVSVATVNSSHNLTTNDTLANPVATVTSYANVGDIGGGSTVFPPAIYTIPASGGITVSVEATGMMTVDSTAVSAMTGIYTFDYQLANSAGSDTATVTLSVQVGPIANDDSFVMLLGSPLGGDLNDVNGGSEDSLGVPPGSLTSFGGGSLSGSVADNAAGSTVSLAGGNLTVNSDGTFSLVDTTQAGIFTFQYRLANAAASDDATVTIEIREAPSANDDGIYTVNLGGTLNANDLLANDDRGFPLATVVSFGVGDAGATITPNNIPLAGGTLQVNADGSFSLMTPATAGTYTFDYRLSNVVASADATVTIEVRRVPDAIDDSFDVLVGATLSGVDLNDDNGSGADDLGFPAATLASFGGGDLGGTVTSSTAGASVGLAGGTLVVNADGTLNLSGTTEIGVFTFSYRLTNAGGTDDAVVTIEVRKAPTAVDDGTYLVGTGQTLTVLTTDDNDLLDNDDRGFPLANITSFGIADAAALATPNSVSLAGGTLQVNTDGSFSLTNPTIPGNYTFLYRLSNVVNFDDAQVSIQVQQSPVANDDSFNMLVTQTLNGDLTIDNGSGADNAGTPSFNSLTFGGGDAGGTITTNDAGASVDFAGGTLTVNLNGTFSLDNPTQTGVFTFQYRLSNTIPAFDDATVTISINQAPDAVNDSYFVPQSGSITVNASDANDLLDNDFLGFPPATVTGVCCDIDGRSFGVGVLTTVPDGELIVNADGSFTFTSTGLFGPSFFEYTIANIAGSDTATVNLTITKPPVAQADSFATEPGTDVNGDLTNNKSSGVDDLGYPAATIVSIGGGNLGGDVGTNLTPVAGLPFAGGLLSVNADGTFSLANPTLTGTYTFQYRLSNIAGSSETTVTIDVRTAPDAVDDGTYIIGTGGTLVVAVADGNDLLDNDTLGYPSATIVSFGGGGLTGDASANPTPGNTALAGGTLQVNADGSFSLTTPTIPGSYSFNYRLGNSAGSDDATVTINVQQAPVAANDSFQVQINATLNGDVTGNNGNGTDTLGYPVATVASFGGGSLAGDVETNAAGSTVTLAGGDLTVNADGTFSLVNPTTTGVHTFQYRLGNTIPASSDATVTIDVRATPVAQDDSGLVATHATNTTFPAGTLFADNGSGVDFLGVPAATIVSFGGGEIVGSTLVTDFAPAATTGAGTFAGGTLTVNADGSFGVNNPTEAGDYTFYYRLQNPSGFDDALVVVTIQRAPEAFADTFTFLYTDDQSAPSSLFANNGGGGDIVGYPAAALTHFGGGFLGGTVMDNDAGESVSLAGGMLTVNADGSWSLTGQPFTPGAYTFVYRIANVVDESTATVTLNIQEQPAAVDDVTYTVVSGQTLNLLEGNGLLANDTRGFPLADIASYGGGNAGGDVTTYAANTSVDPIPGYLNGMLQINAAGTGVFTPPTLPTPFCGEFDFSYRLDNGVGSDDADVTIAVLCAPDAQNDLFNSGFTVDTGGVAHAGNLFADNGSGADFLGYETAALSGFSAVGGGVTSNAPGSTIALADGTMTVNADGTYSVDSVSTPGTYTFDYTITNTAGSDTATVTIVIDEAPRVLNDFTPVAGAVDVPITTDIVLNFSEPVDIAAGGITLECPENSDIAFTPALPVTNVTSFTVDPTTDLPGNTLCVVTVVSSLVTDTDTNDAPNALDGDSDGIEGPDFTSSFTTAPVANDDAYTVTPHLTYDSSTVTPTALSVRNNDDPADATAITGFGPTLATANDTLPDGTNFIAAGGAGGRVVLYADGTFTFYPDAGDKPADGTVTFFYTITGGDTAEVTLTFTDDDLVWFVDDDATDTVCTTTNDGTQACPAVAPDSDLGTVHTGSDTIFIAEGAYECSITLKNNVKVIGDGATGTTLETFSGVTPVSGSSFAPYDGFTGTDPVLTSAASCFTLGTGNTVRGLTVGDTTGYALISPDAVGTLIVTDVSINGDGGMFSLTNGGTFNGTFNELSSDAHTNAVIDLTNIDGTISHTSGTISHANAANPTVRIGGGNPTLTYSGGITKTAGGRVIDIQATTSNTISFTGTVAQNVAAGTGIFIDDQTGGTVSFTTINLGSSGTRLTSTAVTATDGSGTSTVTLGTINLYTNGAAAHALVVTGHNGTLNVTGGTVDATNGGQAINIDGPAGATTLAVSLSNVASSGSGSFGVQLADTGGTFAVTTLASISNKTDGLLISNSSVAVTIDELDVSNTTADAVRLSTNTGSFTITGDGAATNADGVGGTFTTIGENAFDMTNVQNVTLNDMTITGTGSHAFTGTGVNNLAIDNVDISNAGNADNEHVFNFKDGVGGNLTGTVSITDSLFSNFTENGMYIENFGGSLNLTVSNSEFENNITTTGCGGGNCDGMGLLLRADGTSSMTVTINQVTFDRIDGIGVSANPEGNSGSSMDIDITNSTFTANAYAGASNTNNGETAISLRNAQGNGTLNFNVFNNTVNNYSGELALGVIEVEAGDFADTSGFINANTVHGAPLGNAIALFADGSHTSGGGTTAFDLIVSVTNNTVNGPLFGVALNSNNNGAIAGSNVNTHLTVTGNNFNAVPTGSARRPITVNVRELHNVCVNITGNTVSAGTGGTGPSVNLSYNGTGIVRLQGMSGSGDANAVTYLNSNNTLAVSAISGPNNNVASATCATPAP